MWSTPLKQAQDQLNQPQSLRSPSQMKYITVSCRLKPLLQNEEKAKIEVDKKMHVITLNDPTKSISKTYSFDEIFDETICQDRFTNHICSPLVEFLKNGGESGLIFSYGITNSGKTYSILGTKEQPGILLNLIKRLEEQFKDETLNILACELYNDEFMSLKNKGEKLQPKEKMGTITFGEYEPDLINKDNMEDLFNEYLQNRSCSSTHYNIQSSRSHAIFKISCSKFKIGVVDLAGSERTCKTQGLDKIKSKELLKETVSINKSLLTLKKCIKVLEERSTSSLKAVVPYRQSKLTQALVEYFVENSKINIIVNINQARHCLEQNLNVMDYTSTAKNITANSNSDFSIMFKTTNKKMEVIKAALKEAKQMKSISKKGNFKSQLSFTKKETKNKILPKNPEIEETSDDSSVNEPPKSIWKQLPKMANIQEAEEKKLSDHISTTVQQNSHQDEDIDFEMKEIIENSELQKNEHKTRYSVQFKHDEKVFIVNEDIFEDEYQVHSLEKEIMNNEREKYIRRTTREMIAEQLADKPLPLHQYLEKQELFLGYLMVDRQMQLQADRRKLSALKKVNFFETTQKKPQKPIRGQVTKEYDFEKNRVSICIGTEEDKFMEKKSFENELQDLKFEQLKTQVKRKLINILEGEKRKLKLDCSTSYSGKKNRVISPEEKQDNQMSMSKSQPKFHNFMTPSKSTSRNNIHVVTEIPGEQSDQIQQKNKSEKKGFLQRTVQKVTSGLKKGADAIANTLGGLGNHVFRTNMKQQNNQINGSLQKKMRKSPKKKFQIYKEISQLIDPTKKIICEFATNTQVQIVPSCKKTVIVSEKKIIPKVHEDGVVEIDGQAVIEQKKLEIETFEVGIQTDEFKLKYALEEQLTNAIKQEKEKKKERDRNKANKKGHDLEKVQEKNVVDKKEKTAFKNFSIKKNEIDYSMMEKRKAFVTSSKRCVAKNTRGAQRKKHGQI